MRKILNKQEIEKKRTRNRIIVGGILIVIMLVSTLGYSFLSGFGEDSNIEKINYKGVEFMRDAGFWKFTIHENSFATNFNPKETENISVPILTTLNSYYQKPVYFYEEKEAKGSGAKIEIAKILQSYVLRMQDVCYDKAKNCDENLPIKNCTDNLIIFKESEDIKISQEENCVFLSAPYEEQLRTADAFIFKILGI